MANRRLFLQSLFAIAVAKAAEDLKILKLTDAVSKYACGIDPAKPGIGGTVFKLYLPKGAFHHGDIVAMGGMESQWIYLDKNKDGNIIMQRVTDDPDKHQVNTFVVDHSDAARNREVHKDALLLCSACDNINEDTLWVGNLNRGTIIKTKFIQS